MWKIRRNIPYCIDSETWKNSRSTTTTVTYTLKNRDFPGFPCLVDTVSEGELHSEFGDVTRIRGIQERENAPALSDFHAKVGRYRVDLNTTLET